MDGENHNFLLSEDCNVFGYSYMSFEIKDKIETEQLLKANEFDITPFNYVFNKSTSIIDSNDILANEHIAFETILQNIYNLDPSYLEQLNYFEFNKINGKEKK